MRKTVGWWVGVVAFAAATAHAASGDGLQSQFDNQAWDGLRGRLTLGTVTPLRTEVGSIDASTQKVNSMSLMGDYYLSQPWLGTAGGLRATSGVLLGSRVSLWSSPTSMDRRSAPTTPADGSSDSTLPYLGVGYTGLSSKGGWGLSADLGLMATPRSSVRLGKVFNGTQSLDDAMRDLRFAPLLQVGVSYSF
ncbi:MAG: hypothetical protein ABI605_03895 [Rhizobacter sp.]